MATHYTATSNTYNHYKYGRTNTSSGTWTKVWYQMSIYVSVAADGTCTYTITSTNNADDYSDWPRCQVSVWVEIGGETVVAQSFYKGDGFPRYLNSTKSGTLTNKITGSTVSIKSKILPASDWNAHSDWWSDALSTSTLTRNYWTDGTNPTLSKIEQKTAGSNVITFTGTNGTSGTNNAWDTNGSRLYYKANGATSYSHIDLGTSNGASFTKTITITKTCTVSAYIVCDYKNNNGSSYSSSSPKTLSATFYGTGNTPGAPSISQTTGDNTITITGDRGNSPTNNAVKSSTLYYKFAGDSSYTSVTLSTSSTTYTKTFEMTSGNNKKKLLAKVSTEYTYGGTKTGSETTSTNNCLYYSSVGTGTVSITDNGNNTFTLSGTKGADGSNNAATGPTLSWGYDTKYSNSFTNGATKDLTIATPANATRTVYAKSVTGKTNYGSDKTATTSLAVKQYVAPSAPSNIKLSYSKSRLTVKENWTLEWTGGTKTNDSSPIKGYRIRLYKNGQTMPLKNASGEIKTSDSGEGTARYYYDRDKTDTTMVISTSTNTFAPGDKIKFYIHAYTKNGNSARIFSTGIWSPEYTVQNAGVMQVKVRTGGTDAKPVYGWKEGVVWVKVNKGTTSAPNIKWVEADIVKTKVNTGTTSNPSYSWKESN